MYIYPACILRAAFGSILGHACTFAHRQHRCEGSWLGNGLAVLAHTRNVKFDRLDHQALGFFACRSLMRRQIHVHHDSQPLAYGDFALL
jgi:hypothetical protein